MDDRPVADIVFRKHSPSWQDPHRRRDISINFGFFFKSIARHRMCCATAKIGRRDGAGLGRVDQPHAGRRQYQRSFSTTVGSDLEVSPSLWRDVGDCPGTAGAGLGADDGLTRPPDRGWARGPGLRERIQVAHASGCPGAGRAVNDPRGGLVPARPRRTGSAERGAMARGAMACGRARPGPALPGAHDAARSRAKPASRSCVRSSRSSSPTWIRRPGPSGVQAVAVR